MASKKTRTARPAKQDGLIKAKPKPIAGLPDPILLLSSRLSDLERQLDALRIRLDALEASRLAYAPAQRSWWCLWTKTN